MRKLLLLFAITACSSDDPVYTYDVAQEYADHVCSYFERCDALDTSFEDCVALVVEGTCPEATCSTADQWHGDAADRDACFSELDVADCANVEGDPPTACAGVL